MSGWDPDDERERVFMVRENEYDGPRTLAACRSFDGALAAIEKMHSKNHTAEWELEVYADSIIARDLAGVVPGLTYRSYEITEEELLP
jgi:hypothetical protein